MEFNKVFTPLFILFAVLILIGGLVILQIIDRLFAGSTNLTAIRIFFLAIIINIIILLFLIMSFSKIKFQPGPVGPQGNKGYRGIEGSPGSIKTCKINVITAQEKKIFDKTNNYLDLKPPLIIDD
jgi:hypothetical protein